MVAKLFFFLILILLGLLGNIFNIEMFFVVNQIFGSIFVLFATWYFGPFIGTIAALIIHSYTVYLWGHPYAYISFTLEAFVVGLLLKKKLSNIFIADAIYWIFIGVWLVPIFYGNIIGLPTTQVELIMLKQVANGILNALIATLLSLIFMKYVRDKHTIHLRDVIFTIMVTIVTLSLYISANIITKENFIDMSKEMMQDMKKDGQHLKEEIQIFVDDNIQTIKELDEKYKDKPIENSFKTVQSVYSTIDSKEIQLIAFNKNATLVNKGDL